MIEGEELYAEPSYFYQPAKQCLGAVLMQQGRAPEAEVVYREDLGKFPDNVWSLVGLELAGHGGGPKAGGGAAPPPALTRALGDADPKADLSTSCPAFE